MFILIYSKTHKTLKEDDFQAQFMILKSLIIMKHSNCAVQTDIHLLKKDIQATKCRFPNSLFMSFKVK